jgi:outer membrane protein OmpA-like peptidoglycan-associated protein
MAEEIVMRTRLAVLAAAATLILAGMLPSAAQTIGYAEALGSLAEACGKDIGRYCSKANLGGGEVAECLERHSNGVSGACKAASADVGRLLRQRSAARASVQTVCELDRLKFCGGIQPGNAQILGCMYATRNALSPACRQALADSGYEARLDPGPLGSQIHLGSHDIVSSLVGVENTSVGLDVARMRQIAAQAAQDPSRNDPYHRPPLFAQLDKLSQLTIAIQFDFDSARINPRSYRSIGLMADALYHPALYGYCFLIVGNTDATGRREYNLKLSERRAESIRQAMINPFGLGKLRVDTLGLGEEQLLNRQNPKAAENRRVQLINVGQLPNNPECPVVGVKDIR